MIWEIKHNVVWKEGRIAFRTLALTDARPQYHATRFFRVGVFQVFVRQRLYYVILWSTILGTPGSDDMQNCRHFRHDFTRCSISAGAQWCLIGKGARRDTGRRWGEPILFFSNQSFALYSQIRSLTVILLFYNRIIMVQMHAIMAPS